MKCSLCGFEFEKSAASCSSCPMHGNCEMLRCPHCGYEFVEESKIVNWFKRLWKVWKPWT